MMLKKHIIALWHLLGNKYFYSLLCSLILIILSYFFNNFSIFTGEYKLKYYIVQNICETIGIHKKVNYGNAIYYNVTYDKMFVPAICKGDTLGKKVVTDRQKLLRFLQLLEKTDNYKYIIIDLLFDKRDSSVYDDSLFNQIQIMRDVVVANDTRIPIANSYLIKSNKTGLVTYNITKISTDFGRLEYKKDEGNSLPLVVYESLNPDERMIRYRIIGPLSYYKIGGKLCQNSCFLTFDNSFTEDNSVNFDNNSNAQSGKYINLGKFINNPLYNESLLLNLVRNNTNDKYVVIGDFNEDLHDTYIGRIPGSIIMMRGLATLAEGGNLVYGCHILLWFIAFFVINLSILYEKPISMMIPYLRNIPYRWFHFSFSLLSFSSVLVLCSIIEYICSFCVYSLVIPILYFNFLKMYIQFKKISK